MSMAPIRQSIRLFPRKRGPRATGVGISAFNDLILRSRAKARRLEGWGRGLMVRDATLLTMRRETWYEKT